MKPKLHHICFNRFFILSGLVLFLAGSAIFSQDGFWVPLNPPKSHYIIDGKIDLKEGFIEGKETVVLNNNTNRPICVMAFDWNISESSSIDITAAGVKLTVLNSERGPFASSPLLYKLPEPIDPGSNITFDITFRKTFEFSDESTEFGTTHWYPRIWWDDLPVHDSFSVKLEIPGGFALAISGRLNEKTERYETEGARTFGIYLGRGQQTVSQEMAGVLITALFTEKGAKCAEVCLETAVDAIKYYKDWLGFYPFKFLYIIPGGSGRWGGYPFATGIVVIHGMETFKEGESLYHWKAITAHEIGHEYWGEWVLDPDEPAWVWIGMGIFADTEYKLAKKINPTARANWMSNYLQGASMYYDTTVDIPSHWLSQIKYDRNNTVTHSKGFSIISALDSVLGRETFLKIYKKCLSAYGGRSLGWRDLQRVCEKESGEELDWFFDQWVRSNKYLCYKIVSQESQPRGDGYVFEVKVRRFGTMDMPVPVKAVFEDGSEQVKKTGRNLEVSILTFESRAKLKEAVLNPENKLAILDNVLPEISDEAKELLSMGWRGRESDKVYELIKGEDITNDAIWYRLGMYLYEEERFPEALECFKKVSELNEEGITKFAALSWLGLLSDLLGEREKALAYYREALRYDTGEEKKHGWLRINMDRQWVEEKIKTPFSPETVVDIPSQPTAEQLIKIVDDLNWKWEGKTPFFIYEKARDLDINRTRFWFKLGMLLFDSGYYPESFAVFEKVSIMESAKLQKFAAFTWMGHLKDLLGEREEAIGYYKKALEYDSGDTMIHSQYRMEINRKWVEKRLKMPFTWKKMSKKMRKN